MPEDYGFDYERVRGFMLGTFDFMLNATDAELGAARRWQSPGAALVLVQPGGQTIPPATWPM